MMKIRSERTIAIEDVPCNNASCENRYRQYGIHVDPISVPQLQSLKYLFIVTYRYVIEQFGTVWNSFVSKLRIYKIPDYGNSVH